MELRGKNEEIGMRNSLTKALPNRKSPTSSSPSLVPNGGERRHQNAMLPSHTLNSSHYLFHLHQSNPLQQTQLHVSDPDTNPYPLSAIATISGATRSESRLRPPPATATATATLSVRYQECLKNHGASMGTHVLDGCGEFMPSGQEGTPEALKCAACECHRSFHRKETDGESQYVANCYSTQNPNANNNRRGTISLPQLPSAVASQPSLQQYHQSCHGLRPGGSPTSPATCPNPAKLIGFAGIGGALTESSSEDLDIYQPTGGAQTAENPSPTKKRFRTKFTQEQKDKMLEFAEKLGWKIQKRDEQEVQQFCSEVGVKRQAFKVWMHNKQAMKRKQI